MLGIYDIRLCTFGFYFKIVNIFKVEHVGKDKRSWGVSIFIDCVF